MGYCQKNEGIKICCKQMWGITMGYSQQRLSNNNGLLTILGNINGLVSKNLTNNNGLLWRIQMNNNELLSENVKTNKKLLK